MNLSWMPYEHVKEFIYDNSLFTIDKYINVSDNVYEVSTNISVIEKVIDDFNTVNTKLEETIKIYIVKIDGNYIQQILSNCSSERRSLDDSFIFKSENGTWILISSIHKIGISFIINKDEDQWGSPLFEQYRWQLAIHVTFWLEKNFHYAIHASAVEKDGKVILIFGLPKAGKSTLLSKYLFHDWKLVSDDRIIIYMENGNVKIERFWKSLKLRGDVHDIQEVKWFLTQNNVVLNTYNEDGHGTSKRIIPNNTFFTKINKLNVSSVRILKNNYASEVFSLGEYLKLISDSFYLLSLDGKTIEHRKNIFKIANNLLTSNTVQVTEGKKTNINLD